MNNTISKYQTEVRQWQEHNFPDVSPHANAASTLGLVEEVGEVCRAICKMEQGIRGTREEWLEDLRKEMGDVFIKVCDVATRYEIDLEKAVHDRWSDIQKRDWQKDKVQHGI